ncbi:uncharacterized protein LOC135168125 [Diachasmimorpha longicaudata]|uniref:uncharacterized protein LOC135168125 n=1 Tax=Diachasmimorpha longicaudata TaxID=58733 RepID=UPI0030B8D681
MVNPVVHLNANNAKKEKRVNQNCRKWTSFSVSLLQEIGSIYQNELNNTPFVRVATRKHVLCMKKMINVIRYHTLAKSFLALRGRQQDLSQDRYHGNFLPFVELVARYDHILQQALDMPKEQIRASPFLVIIMDTPQDISKADQLSIVVRYTAITRSENGQLMDPEVKDGGLNFHVAIKHDAGDLANYVTTLFIDKNIDLKNVSGKAMMGQ